MRPNHITEGLNQVYLEKRYSGKLRDFEGTTSKVVKYGIATLTPLSLIGTAIMYIYRRNTDKCGALCGDRRGSKCYNKCYADACKSVIAKIDSEISKAKKISDDSKRKGRIASLQKERQKWVVRLNKYTTRYKSQ
jgi:hypothetical protein